MSQTLTIGEYIRKRRKALDLTQQELADRLARYGVEYTNSTIGWWEGGRTNPPLHDTAFIGALTKSLEVPDWIFFRAVGLIKDDLADEDISYRERKVLEAFRRGDFEDMMRIAMRET